MSAFAFPPSMVYSKAWVRVVCLGGGHRELREGVKWVIISSYCGDMGPNIAGPPGRLWVAAQIVPPLQVYGDWVSVPSSSDLLEVGYGLLPGSLRGHLSPQPGNVLMEGSGNHGNLPGTCPCDFQGWPRGYRWVPDNVSCIKCDSRGGAGESNRRPTPSTMALQGSHPTVPR